MSSIIRKILLTSCHVCPAWFSFSLNNKIRRLFHNPEKLMREFIIEGQTVMDIGCGPGFFSLAMARMVGDKGRVISVDVQQKMLDKLDRDAKKAGLRSRILLHRSEEDGPGISEKVDFALAFWMMHEVQDPENLFRQIRNSLKPDATFLLVEPKLHVTGSRFNKFLKMAEDAGFKPERELKVWFSRAMVFKRN